MDPMTIKGYCQSKQSLRYILFSGKGGVGKTTLSAASAYWLASLGKRVCIFSIDPQASLSDIFEQDVFARGEVEVAPNLFASEFDPDERVREFQEKMRANFKRVYGLTEIPEATEDTIEVLAAEPAITVASTFDAMTELMASGKDYYIFDMMPHSHAIRFLGLTEALNAWVNKGSYEGGPLSKDLNSIRSGLEFISSMMRNVEHTAFFYVLVPEFVAILDAKKALEKFARFGIPLSGILVNMVYPVELLEQPNIPSYLRNRIVNQQKNLEAIRGEFGLLLRGIVPMFDQEPKGLAMIAKVSEVLFGKARPLSVEL